MRYGATWIFLTIFSIAFIGPAARADNLPKSGTVSIHSGWYFDGSATEVDEKRMYFEGTWWGVSFNNAGSGFLHLVAWQCPAVTEAVDSKIATEGAKCTLTDGEGAKIFGDWIGRGTMGGAFSGQVNFTGGTGKYSGISGSLTFDCNSAGDSGFQLHCQQQVNYSLQ